MPFRKAQSDAHSELTPNFAAQAAVKQMTILGGTTTPTNSV
ncbi:hypothetical protein ACFQHW_00985 [Lapidilactobacillus achengensis]|uniref:Uncharacterized protein n=1 Tax=Lapidilactobacillus achengensis TaxID=2486000 RepID=A0ABW1UN12_9LACO|nr:hypothetical protein [Lapidilactobacillus achengensis]